MDGFVVFENITTSVVDFLSHIE